MLSGIEEIKISELYDFCAWEIYPSMFCRPSRHVTLCSAISKSQNVHADV